jgi:hypothetical protein
MECIMRAIILLGLLVPTSFATAQATSQAVTPDGKIHTRIEGINIPPVANSPFTAKVVVTWDQPMVGGGTVSRKYYTLVARDSQGRVRRETRDFIPADSSAEPPLQSFAISDPVSSTRITCVQSTMNCTVVAYHVPLFSTDVASGPPTGQTKGLSRQNLGQQTMNSVPVVGTRETSSTVAGTGGYSRVVITSKDLWYSPDLNMYLSVIRKDPQLGQITLTVTDLLRSEPDPTWFAVPAGYKMVDSRNQAAAH